MHKLFSVPELVEAIVEQSVERVRADAFWDYSLALVTCNITITSWETLKALNSTSKLFRNPCLNAIWQHQTSLVPLLRSANVVSEQIETHKRIFKCVRLLTPADMRKIAFYSSRIMSLSVSPFRPLHAQMSHLHFHKLLPPGVLFSRLRHISWLSDETSGPEILFVLRTVGTALTHVSGPRSTAVLLHLQQTSHLSSMKLLCLKSDRGGRSPDDPAFCPALCTILQGCTTLRKAHVRLNLDEDSTTIWTVIAKLPELRTCLISQITLFNKYSCTAATFVSLTTLELHFLRIGVAIDLFQASRFPCLREMTVKFEALEAEIADEAIVVSGAIASSCTDGTLLDVHMSFTCSHDRDRDHPLGFLNCEVLRPFLGHSRMQRFVVGARDWFLCLNDDFISDMLHAWPGILKLHLNQEPYGDLPASPGRSITTFRSLEAVAALCPHIEELGAIISDDPITPLTSRSRLLTPNASLNKLDVGISPIADPIAMATLLSGLFPSLKRLWFSDDHPEEISAKWLEVEKLIPAMVAIRREERDLSVARGAVPL